jgi:hypothetical protein
MNRNVLRRYAVVFILSSVVAATLVELGKQDKLPVAIGTWAIVLLAPGFLLRGLASGSELGFQDWRDVVLMAVGSAGVFTAIFAVLDIAFRRRRGKSDA